MLKLDTDMKARVVEFARTSGERVSFLSMQCLNCKHSEDIVVDPTHLDTCDNCGAHGDDVRVFASALTACVSCGEPTEPQGIRAERCNGCAGDADADARAYRVGF